MVESGGDGIGCGGREGGSDVGLTVIFFFH